MNYYLPRDQAIAAKYVAQFPKLNLFTVVTFSGWKVPQPKFFGNGGLFDQIYTGR